MSSDKRPNGTEKQSNRDMEKQRSGDTDATDETEEVPPLAACVKTLPEAVQLSLKNGLNEDCLFVFSRALKAFEVTNNRRLPLVELQSAFAQWWNAAKPLLPPDAGFDEWRFSFQDAYAKARTPLGANLLEEAIRRAQTAPPPSQANRYSGTKLKLLVAVCYHLQVLSCGHPFFLSARCAARVTGVRHPREALIMLNGLISDEVIILAEKGKPGGRRANRYRFNSPEFRLPELETPEQPDPGVASTKPARQQPCSVYSPRTITDTERMSTGSLKPITHFQLVQKKKALEDLLKPFEGKESNELSADQRNERKELRARLEVVTRRLATFGERC